jgi:hypothetical protein
MPATFMEARCSRCGSRLRQGHYVYSRFTGNRYCSNLDACTRRAKRALSRRERGEHELTADHAGAEALAAPHSRPESARTVA